MPSPSLGLPYVSASQSQKHATVNEAIRFIDVLLQCSVKNMTLTAPPGSPATGDRYVIASGATGAWAAKDLNLTVYNNGVWEFIVPKKGFIIFDENSNTFNSWNGTSWTGFASGKLISAQFFGSSGTWTKPVGCRLALVFNQAAGGGGGGATGVAASVGVGGGGGAGGLSIELVNVTALGNQTVTIGAAGAAGANTGGNGGTGGTTSFGALCSATGGTGGTGQVAGTTQVLTNGGSGGSGSGGDWNFTGSAGDFGIRFSGTLGLSGKGAPGFLGQGAADARQGSAAGGAGNAPGAGGSGAATNSATAQVGGAGGAGLVWVLNFE